MYDPNMRMLRPSRRKLRPGDVFALKPGECYLFGRVIYTDMPVGPMGPGSNLIYIYDARANTETPALAALVTNRLLIPPQIINRLPWSRGYLMTVHHADLQPGDVLLDHCFFDPARRRHVGLDGKPRDADFEPCGSWGLNSFASLDDTISQALGIPLAPD